MDKIIIRKRSHHFVVENLTPTQWGVVNRYSRTLIQYNLVPRPGGRGMVKEAGKVFASADKDRTWVRYHINCLEEFLEHLGMAGIHSDEINIIEEAPHKPEKVVQPVKDFWQDREHQVPVIEYLTKSDGPIARMVALQTGKGKAQPVRANVKVPGGWSAIGKLQTGDYINRPDGSIALVVGVHPQGIKDVYTLTFEDGREALACAEHLWKVYIGKGTKKSQIIDTLSLNELLLSSPIPICIDTVHAAEEQTIESFKLMMHLYSKDTIYLDADTVNVYEIDEVMAERLVNIARSIGGRAQYFGEGREKFVEIKMGGIEAMGLDTKVRSGYADSKRLVLRSIEKNEEQEECVCITIDSEDNLYVTDNYIVTHNSYCAMRAAQVLEQRFVYFMKGGYISKWVEDLKKTYDYDIGDYIEIKGAEKLKKLIKMAIAGKPIPKSILISNGTMRGFFEDFEMHGARMSKLGWECTPDELFEVLKAGTRVTDEIHQELYFNFKLDMYTNISRSIGLSATFVSRDPFITKMQLIQHPKNTRYDTGVYDRYISAYGVNFNFKRVSAIQTMEYGSKNYSHNAVERSILKNKDMLENYCQLIDRQFKAHFLSIKDEGEKALIFCSSIRMATHLKQWFAKKYKDMDVRRYVEDDPYANLRDGEVVITTLLSAGAAQDISMLRTVIMTTSVDSIQSNEQALGRLRVLASENTPRFVYLYSKDIPKQQEYHINKQTVFRGKVKNHSNVDSGMSV